MTAVSLGQQQSGLHADFMAGGGGSSGLPSIRGAETMTSLHHPAQRRTLPFAGADLNTPPIFRSSMSVSLTQSHNEDENINTTLKKAVSKERRNNGQPVRRRISRACDQCNQLRTKCDGKHPCAHCVEFGITCEYARERKKRGKASKKDIAAQQAAANAATTSPSGDAQSSDDSQSDHRSVCGRSEGKRRKLSGRSQAHRLSPQHDDLHVANESSQIDHGENPQQPMTSMTSNVLPRGSAMPEELGITSDAHRHDMESMQDQHDSISGFAAATTLQQMPLDSAHALGLPMGTDQYNRSNHVPQHHQLHSLPHHQHQPQQSHHFTHMDMGDPLSNHAAMQPRSSNMMHHFNHSNGLIGFGESAFSLSSPNSQAGLPASASRFDDPGMSTGYFAQPPMAGLHGWGNPQSPSGTAPAPAPAPRSTASSQSGLRYPVLRPLLPYLANIFPVSVACELLEAYFASASATFMHPQSPYVIGHVFRKRSFLRRTNPRSCSPALLASMLWVAAQTSGSAFLNSSPSTRGRICQRLLELTISLLKPLIHAPQEGCAMGSHLYSNPAFINGVAMGTVGGPLAGTFQHMGLEENSPGAAGDLDDIATYLHLSTVVSASEYKGASLRWWHAAWSLARELHLGRELPSNTSTHEHAESEQMDGSLSGGPDTFDHGDAPGWVSDEEREERRRLWWLLYIVDRHLALCYNRPLALLDAECNGLLRPEDEARWQAGEYYTRSSTEAQNINPGSESDPLHQRSRASDYAVTSHDIFGFFTPIMTILGEIVDLHHARSHPRFALPPEEYDAQAAEISQHLDTYRANLTEFEAQTSASIAAQRATYTNNSVSQQQPPPQTSSQQPQQPQHKPTNPQPNDIQPSTSPAGTGPAPSQPPPRSPSPSPYTQRLAETALQTNIITAYGTHLYHVMQILLRGKWDPISLLDDTDLWISSPSFVEATRHAVAAADAITQILDYDPDLSFMPWFFGIYLLQGSLLLLLIADKLQGEASANVVRACEAIVRAHEACVVTLNTEYQRNFRKVMRSALAQVRGRAPTDFGDLQARRREVLALYRWTGEGTGLAL